MYAQSVHDLYYIGDATVGNFSQKAIERPDDNMYLRDRFDNITHQIENIRGRQRICMSVCYSNRLCVFKTLKHIITDVVTILRVQFCS